MPQITEKIVKVVHSPVPQNVHVITEVHSPVPQITKKS